MVKNNKNICFFNMIEVALAMAIIAFGMTSILGLFPVGLNACRNSIAENCAADTVEQFSSYLKGYAGSSKANFETLLGTSAGTGYYNTNTNPMADAVTATAAQVAAKDFLDAIVSGIAAPVYKGWTIFPYDSATPPSCKNIYFTVMGAGDYFHPASTKFPTNDFSALIAVWKSPLTYYRPNDTLPLPDGWTQVTDDAYATGAALNIEISWPLDVADYNARQKRTFYIEIVKPQQ